ncbi:hypothetical protein BDV29DRAFT_33186 [Aspergillus leporis]|uniref:Uncharacterized protein n=1 Tax=Aspergillus leporis TaxID=41062 RepID=A0A5N5WS11_9EURO|nr:hypothetical protein BDV29DRAFT_33186 [Aspergillus leporis]
MVNPEENMKYRHAAFLSSNALLFVPFSLVPILVDRLNEDHDKSNRNKEQYKS